LPRSGLPSRGALAGGAPPPGPLSLTVWPSVGAAAPGRVAAPGGCGLACSGTLAGPPGCLGVGRPGPRSIRPRSLSEGSAAPGLSGATPGLEGGVRLEGGGGPPAGGLRSASGGAAAPGALVGVNLGGAVGLPFSRARPGAPGSGETLPGGLVPGLPGGVRFSGGVARGAGARGVAAGVVTPRGDGAAGETAPGLPGDAAGFAGAPGAAGSGLPGARAAARVGGGTFFGFSV
jgi:hypothetical protein